MKCILKYGLEITDTQEVSLPLGSQILSAKNQRGCLKMWVLVDPHQKESKKETIHIVGTGYNAKIFDCEVRFIDTIIFSNESLVWHVFHQK